MIHRTSLLPVFVFIGIPLTVLFAYFGLNYSGFCFAKMRYLTNEEKIRSVFDFQNNYQNDPEALVVQVGESKIEKHIKYESFDKYIQENPDCCAINPGGAYDIRPLAKVFLCVLFSAPLRLCVLANASASRREAGRSPTKKYLCKRSIAIPSFLDRIFGFSSGDIVVINFKARYLEKNGKQILKEIRFENRLQNCGKPQ
ncbi:hypothetical protein FACHB389_18590 [Nostoc calcicola FACHB-389]|nr:hypothetical protein [Nostoc calcicola FACHB-3891]OKH33075.1 hypothetical protein FACHB389_18590 [Nostoc calcicola FACHB-389]